MVMAEGFSHDVRSRVEWLTARYGDAIFSWPGWDKSRSTSA